jgi:hypothetical protein
MVMSFPSASSTGEILRELEYLQGQGTVRVIDLVLVSKDAAGAIVTLEVSDLKVEAAVRYGWITGDLLSLLGAEEIATAVSAIPANSSAALLVVEHLWAVRLKEALLRVNGMMLRQETIASEKLAEAGEGLDPRQ